MLVIIALEGAFVNRKCGKIPSLQNSSLLNGRKGAIIYDTPLFITIYQLHGRGGARPSKNMPERAGMKMGLAERLHSFMGYDEEEEFEKEIVQQAPEARVFSLRDDDNSAVLMKLSRMDEAGAAADHLAAGRMVVLNMEESTRESACRLVDFLSGVTYALDGKIKKVAASTYIITPYNVDIMGDLIDELENNGLYI